MKKAFYFKLFAILICSTVSSSVISARQIENSGTEAFFKIGGSQVLTQLDISHSNIGFTITHLARNKVRGKFKEYSGAIFYDPNDVTKTSATFAIEVSSIDTDQKNRDDDLRSDNWFDAEQYPRIIFQSKRAVETIEGFDLVGDITIKGITKEVTLKMEKTTGYYESYSGEKISFYGKVDLKRKDFNVVGNRLWNRIIAGFLSLSNELEVELSIVLSTYTAEFLISRASPPMARIYETYGENGIDPVLREIDSFVKAGNASEFWTIPEEIQHLGLILLYAGKTADAVKVFERNMSAFPEKGYAYSDVAMALIMNNETDRAISVYKKAIEIDPGNAVALEVLRHIEKN